MIATLSAGAVGVSTPSLTQAIEAAKSGGFEGLEFSIHQVADSIDAIGVEATRALFDDAGVKPTVFGVPTSWRSDEGEWKADLAKLPRLAKAAQLIGVNRTATWILSGDNERNFDANWRFHVSRFQPIAEVFGEYGVSVGLEFVGPKTLRDMFRFPFVYTMGGMLAMGREIGPNVGLLLDCWHWFTTEGTADEIKAITAKDVVFVHVNDAPEGKTLDEQLDGVRRLPGDTGIIPIGEFLDALRTIGFNGPIAAEPFQKDLNDLPTDADRLRVTRDSLRKIGV